MRHSRLDYNRIQDPAGLIPDTEPVFLIRGQDIVGPDAVLAWADLAEKAGADRSIIDGARDQARRMRIYQRNRGAKTPDMPEGARVK